MSKIVTAYLLPAVWGYFSCAGFSLMYNIHGSGILMCSIGGAISSFAYFLVLDLSGSEVGAAFVASILVGIYSEVMARIRRHPVTGYLQVALLPLVPGAGVYHAMRYAVDGFTQTFLITLVHTMGIALALSIGAMLSSSLFRAIIPHLPRKRALRR